MEQQGCRKCSGDCSPQIANVKTEALRRAASSAFEQRVEDATGQPLKSETIDCLQVNLGLMCNMSCAHCHVEAAPGRTEIMEWSTMQAILAVLREMPCKLVDLTGGAPEMNPHFRAFVTALRLAGLPVQVRTNLTILAEPGMEDMPEFLHDYQVQLVASMPCYLEQNVRAQRGAGAYEKSVEVIKRLNVLGYGIDPELILNLVYNPAGPTLPPDQASLEADYRQALEGQFGVKFTQLLTITNAPIGRFKKELVRKNEERDYLNLLRNSFNPATLDGLMCRTQLSIGWDGTLFDCDFNLALGLAIDHGAPSHLSCFDKDALLHRRIVTGDHCFACTAGHGSSCGGALS